MIGSVARVTYQHGVIPIITAVTAEKAELHVDYTLTYEIKPTLHRSHIQEYLDATS